MACVRKRRVGKGFRWVLDYRDHSGRRHWETTKGNRKEAERLLAERVRQIYRGTYQAPTERVSFEDLAQAYLKHAEGNVRATTIKDYRCNVNLHLMPWFQGWKVRDIRRANVEAFRACLVDKFSERGPAGQGILGATTVNKCIGLLGQMFRYAIRHEYLDANPAEGAKLRGSSRRSRDLVEANILAPPEIQALLAAAIPAGA